MILRKPYALFIRMFKPIHLLLAVLMGYLIILENRMFSFLSTNLYSANDFVGQNLTDRLVSNGLYLIPIITIILCILVLIVMFTRKKPYAFYVLSIFGAIIVLTINIYSVDFIKTLEETIVSVKDMKVIHDLTLISMIVETILLIIMFIRGAGVNIRKFNFDSDLSKIAIKETDNEEFEVDIKFNLDKSKRLKNKRLRYLKYLYYEKRLLINVIAVIVISLITLLVVLIARSGKKIYGENVYVASGTCNFKVSNSYYINKSYDNRKITDNYLLVLDISIRKNYEKANVYLNDFKVQIGDYIYSPTNRYNKYILDLGNAYDEKLTFDYSDYLIIYEIPKDALNKKSTLSYNDGYNKEYVSLKPVNLDSSITTVDAALGEALEFDKKLEGLSFTINEYGIQNSYVLDFDYCINTNDCIKSKEIIKGSINQNFDKSVMRLSIDFKNESGIKLTDFYDLLSSFGEIKYVINGTTKYQKTHIEKIVSSKKKEKGIIYLGVNKEIENASEVYFLFSIRGKNFNYRVK